MKLLKNKDRVIIPKGMYTIEGRAPGTVEDISVFIDLVVRFRVDLIIKGKLSSLGLPRIDDFANFWEKKRNEKELEEYDKDMIEWVKKFERAEKTNETITWCELFNYSIAFETIRTGYFHYWRQLANRINNEKIYENLEKCVNNTIKLLYQIGIKENILNSSHESEPPLLEIIEQLKKVVDFTVRNKYNFDVKWFTAEHDSCIGGDIDIVMGSRILIVLKVSNSLKLEDLLQLQLYSSFRCELKEDKSLTKLILMPNLSSVYKANCILQPVAAKENINIEKEVIYRVIRRKLQLKFDTENMINSFKEIEQKNKPTAYNQIHS